MSKQFREAVAWWLRAKGCPVDFIIDLQVEDDRGWSELSGEWGSESIVITYRDTAGTGQRFREDVDFAELVKELADVDWEARVAEQDAYQADLAAAAALKAEQLKKLQQETMVALFDPETDKQISDWVPFAAGEVPVPNGWVKGGQVSFQLRTKDGHGISAARPSVKEHVVRTYSLTWNTG